MIDIVLGSFYGDEGKGQTVHNICKRKKGSSLVIRFSGGHQVGHTVRYGDKEHTFSNFGSGTLLDIPTYWSEYCTVDPTTSLIEAEELHKMGVKPCIVYSPLCQVVTPYDVWHQWNDKDNLAHGTVGTGFKPTLDRVKAGYSLTVMDCLNLNILIAKMEAIRDNYYPYFNSEFPDMNIKHWCKGVNAYFSFVAISDANILRKYDNLVFEGSQGILLDQKFGIMPHCTPSNTTSQNVYSLLAQADIRGTKRHWYVTRPYITRHGNGPLCTNTNILEVNDPNNKFNEFQKTLRACEFDIDLFKHSVSIDMLFRDIDYNPVSMVITHKDEIVNAHDILDAINWIKGEMSGKVYVSEYEEMLGWG